MFITFFENTNLKFRVHLRNGAQDFAKGFIINPSKLSNYSWRRRAQIKQLAWHMVERQIEHGKSGLVLSARFPVVNWRSRPVGKSAYYGERSVCYLQAPLRARWVFRTHPSLSRVSGVIAIISEFRL